MWARFMGRLLQKKARVVEREVSEVDVGELPGPQVLAELRRGGGASTSQNSPTPFCGAATSAASRTSATNRRVRAAPASQVCPTTSTVPAKPVSSSSSRRARVGDLFAGLDRAAGDLVEDAVGARDGTGARARLHRRR